MRRREFTARSRRMGQETSKGFSSTSEHATTLDWFLDAEGLDPRAALVAFAISHHLNAEGAAFPSVERLAKMTRMTPRTVESRLQKLMALDLIEDTGRRAGPRGTTRVLRVKNYRPASWQQPRGIPLPIQAGTKPAQAPKSCPQPQAPTPAVQGSTPAVSLTTSAIREQANKGNTFNTKPQEEAEDKGTPPSPTIKARLEEIKLRPRPTTAPGVRHQPAHQRPAMGLYEPPGGTVGPLVRPAVPQSFGAVLSGSLLAALSSRTNPH